MKGYGAVRLFAAIDFLATAPLAIPALTAPWLRMLLSAGGLLPVGAAWIQPQPALLLVAGLLGVLGACWNGARLVWPQDRRLVGIDAFARLAVAALLLLRMAAAGAPPALGLFVLSELLGALAAFFALRRRRASGW